MKFTFESYSRLIGMLRENGCELCSYHSWRSMDKCVILRHDIDFDLKKAVEMAKLENELGGVASTYFVLLTSDFYNPFSKAGGECLEQILNYGHEIGLHFDEARYPELLGDAEAVKEKIMEEAKLLGSAIGNKVDIVSMHRPSRFVLEADLEIPGIINSYGQIYFKEFKYLSDSRRRWREPVDDMILSGSYEKFHILTHPFWYGRTEEDIHRTVAKFVNGGNDFRYQVMTANITDMNSIMTDQEVIRETNNI